MKTGWLAQLVPPTGQLLYGFCILGIWFDGKVPNIPLDKDFCLMV